MVRKSHNIREKDVMALYKAPDRSGTVLRSFKYRLIIHNALTTAMRPTKLSMLGNTQFQLRCVNGEHVWIITGLIGCTDGTCKIARGGVLKINEIRKEIVSRPRDQFDGSRNVFNGIYKYIQAHHNIKMKPYKNSRLFVAINGNASRFEGFF